MQNQSEIRDIILLLPSTLEEQIEFKQINSSPNIHEDNETNS